MLLDCVEKIKNISSSNKNKKVLKDTIKKDKKLYKDYLYKTEDRY